MSLFEDTPARRVENSSPGVIYVRNTNRFTNDQHLLRLRRKDCGSLSLRHLIVIHPRRTGTLNLHCCLIPRIKASQYGPVVRSTA